MSSSSLSSNNIWNLIRKEEIFDHYRHTYHTKPQSLPPFFKLYFNIIKQIRDIELSELNTGHLMKSADFYKLKRSISALDPLIKESSPYGQENYPRLAHLLSDRVKEMRRLINTPQRLKYGMINKFSKIPKDALRIVKDMVEGPSINEDKEETDKERKEGRAKLKKSYHEIKESLDNLVLHDPSSKVINHSQNIAHIINGYLDDYDELYPPVSSTSHKAFRPDTLEDGDSMQKGEGISIPRSRTYFGPHPSLPSIPIHSIK